MQFATSEFKSLIYDIVTSVFFPTPTTPKYSTKKQRLLIIGYLKRRW